jgi:hydroxymethylbilane synthase
MASSRLKLGTRASALARWQAEWVATQLQTRGVEVELVPITTRGDTTTNVSLGQLGGSPGVFTKELQRALLAGTIDLAVHSLKDLPTDVVAGLALAAVPEREDVADVLVSRDGLAFERLPAGAKVGTGSVRRRAQLLHARPDLQMHDIRGNVDTRLGKLASGEYDAIVLALAGLKRLGLAERITQVFSPQQVLPAVGQGALGIESRADDLATREALRALDHQPSHQAVLAERSLLAALVGGCLAPVGAWARVTGEGRLQLDAVVLSDDGRQRLAAHGAADLAAAASLGREVAQQLLAQGASRLIADARNG